MSTSTHSSKPSPGWQPPTLEDMQAMLPQYRFEKLLGRGGMGAVYKAVQASLDRAVAIKVLPGDLVQDDDDAQFAERFKNEARTMAKMSHPSIVNVFDFGETQTGLLYIVMEFIDGTDVAQMILSQGRLPEDYALSITAHVCDALAYAHARGVIHRDIKPANILINIEGAVKVADFGLAKQSDPNQSGLTKTNMAMGTPDFVAPEALIPGVPLDGRADLYAIGVMLYNMLTGEIPRGMWQMPALKVGSDPRFDAIIARAMQNDREARYQTASEIRQELDTILALPRSVIIAQQQAAAEAAAQATRAQKHAEAAAAASNAPQPAPQKKTAPPPPKPKSSLGIVWGIAATFVVAGGLYWLLSTGPEKTPPPSGTSAAEEKIIPALAGQTAQPSPEPPAPPPPSAPDEKLEFGGHRYQLVTTVATWNEAASQSAAVGGHLATLNNREEYEWMMKTIFPAHSDSKFFLGGIRRKPESDPWTWVTGEPFQSEPWMGNFDNNGNSEPLVLSLGPDGLDDVGLQFRPCAYVIEWTPGLTLPAPVAAPAMDTTTPPGWTNLLATAEVKRDSVHVPWRLVDGVLRSPENPVAKATPQGHCLFTFPITAPPPNYDLRYLISRDKQGFAIVIPFVRGGESPAIGIGRRDGFSLRGSASTSRSDTDCLPPDGSTHEVLIEVREKLLRAFHDGQLLIEHHGPLPNGQFDPAFFDPAVVHGPIFGIAFCSGSITVHAASYRPVDVPQEKPMPATSPPTAPKPNPEPDPVIARLDKSFKARHEADAQKPFLEALDKLNQSYLANGIPKARAAAQARGSLAEVTALDAEKARIEKKEAVPTEDAQETPEALKNLRQTYRGALAKITTERDAKTTPLYDIYLKSLDDHIAALTKAGQIPLAQAAQAWRDDLSRQKPSSGSSTAATTTIVPSPSASKAPPPPSGDSGTWRRAAEYLVTHGGYAVAFRDGNRIDIRKPEEIPVEKHDLIELTIDHLNSGRPDPSEDEFQVFNGLRDLRRVWIRIPESRLKVSAYNWLAGNQRLEMVNFEGAGKITDEILTYLSEAKELQELHIQYAPGFTGAGLEKMPFLDTLTNADFLSTGIDEKGVQAISLMKKLTFLRLSAGSVTDKAMRPLSGHKTLLIFDANTTALGDAAAEVLATMPQLTSINLGRTRLTDRGLAKLSVLKNLTSLVITESAVTAKAAEAFEKDLPSCRVTR